VFDEVVRYELVVMALEFISVSVKCLERIEEDLPRAGGGVYRRKGLKYRCGGGHAFGWE
jgi:hypothetical protein